MSLLFGNLTQDFVTFVTAVARAQSGDADAALLVPEAARVFKRTAARDAGYLALIGTLDS